MPFYRSRYCDKIEDIISNHILLIGMANTSLKYTYDTVDRKLSKAARVNPKSRGYEL